MKKEEKDNMNQIMIDIETMGNGSNSALVSLAAVKFDMVTGEKGDVFYKKIDLKSCLDIGLKVNADTIMWWLKQSEDARKELYQGEKFNIADVLKEFSSFCSYEYEIWGNSPRFDLGIMQDAYRALNMKIPWDFRKERDVRTLVSFIPEIKNNWIHKGVGHNPVDDCYNQIDYCSKIWNKITIKKSRISIRPKEKVS